MSDIRPADFRFPEPRKEERVRLPPALPVADVKEPLPECSISLVGQTLRGRKSFPLGGVVFGLLILLVLALAAAVGDAHILFWAVLPAVFSLTFLLARPAAFSCAITSQGVELARPRLTLSYGDIQEVFAPDRRKGADCFAIHLLYTKGFITIPARLDRPSEDVYRFLVNQPLSLTDDRNVPSVLANFLRIQESLFGPENVWVYRACPSLPLGRAARSGMLIGLALLLTGITWVVAGGVFRASSNWFAAGMVCVISGPILAFLCWLIGRQHGGSRIKNWRRSCLVLTPGGIALVQGHLKGELKWREVLGMKIRKKPAFSVAGGQESGPGLVLSVDGAAIVLADIYHRPLEHIYRLMRRFWAQENE
jgi:hypothetical protein